MAESQRPPVYESPLASKLVTLKSLAMLRPSSDCREAWSFGRQFEVGGRSSITRYCWKSRVLDLRRTSMIVESVGPPTPVLRHLLSHIGIDSGAIDHMTHSSYQFNNYNPCPSSRKIVTTDGSLATVVGVGDIQISPTLVLGNVFHVLNVEETWAIIMSVTSPGGRCWFGVELKTFEISIEDHKGKVCGKICERGPKKTPFRKFWSERDRDYSLKLRSTRAGRFLFCVVRDAEKKISPWLFLKGGLVGGWKILASKLRSLGVSPL
ncbi:hypothetical protein CK203_041734 [Vitis vinifera]|uniref:Retrovirus-related Pol polyprotein from transposon TNT 1-94-like beta-barrel domain-containing protein n=1 Tax=Vitis vinifera TaxID=29760 RepID=A0A438HCQ4_VITVI|nr:hypothetical protein CK203_041734 [Vitis vinifera]